MRKNKDVMKNLVSKNERRKNAQSKKRRRRRKTKIEFFYFTKSTFTKQL